MSDLPGFVDPAAAHDWDYAPDASALFESAADYRRQSSTRPAGADRVRRHLFLVDPQKDFCLPRGALFVGGRSGKGAAEDSERIAHFIYRNLQNLTEITCSLDTHLPHQIFFPSFWLDAEGRAPPAHTLVTVASLDEGALRPNPDVAAWVCNGNVAWLERQVRHYCESLERAGKYTLYLWPPHCLLGSSGHEIVGALQEARLFHSYVRASKSFIEVKGANYLTENYSVFGPEVLERHDGQALAVRNDALFDRLLSEDLILVAGQAASHCVKSTVDDLLEEIARRDPGAASKVCVLRDCMSCVVVPDPRRPGEVLADFTPEFEAALGRWEAQGARIVTSDVDLETLA